MIKSKVVYCLTFSQELLPRPHDREQRQDNDIDLEEPQPAAPVADPTYQWGIRKIIGQKMVGHESRPTRSGESHSARPSLSGGTQFGDLHAFGSDPRLGGARHVDSGQTLSPSQSPGAGWQSNSGETLSSDGQDRQVFRDRMPRINLYEKILEVERQREARRREDKSDDSTRPFSKLRSMKSVPTSVLPPAGFTRSHIGSPMEDSMPKLSTASMVADLDRFYSRQRELRAENEQARRVAMSMLNPTPAARLTMESTRSVQLGFPKSLSSMGMGPLRGSGRRVGGYGNDDIQHPISLPPTRLPSPDIRPVTPNEQDAPFGSNRNSPDRGDSGPERKSGLPKSVRRRLFEL
jgi:hypothetical protein